MDGELRRRLDRAAGEAWGATAGVEIVRDGTGLAVYQLRPAWATLIVCLRCRMLGLLPALPRVLRPRHRCSSCGAVIVLEPPREVLEAQGLDIVRLAIRGVES